MPYFSIYEDRVEYYRDRKATLPPIDGLPLRLLADLALGAARHRAYLERHEGIVYRISHDYDRSPLEDNHEIMYGGPVHSASTTHKSSVTVTFNAWYGDEPDYVAPAARSTTTAYKRGRYIKPEETGFKAWKATVSREQGDPEAWILVEAVRLRGVLDGIDAGVSSLDSWVASGMDMWVLCSKTGCRTWSDEVILSNARLADLLRHGSSLTHMREKLVCKKCGSRNPSLRAW